MEPPHISGGSGYLTWSVERLVACSSVIRPLKEAAVRTTTTGTCMGGALCRRPRGERRVRTAAGHAPRYSRSTSVHKGWYRSAAMRLRGGMVFHGAP